MKVARIPSKNVPAKQLKAEKAEALDRARRLFGSGATVHAYFGGEWFAEVPAGRGLSRTVRIPWEV